MREPLTRAEKLRRNRLDRQINAIVAQDCAGLAINVMDIGKVFAAGYAAAAADDDVRAAVLAKYRELAIVR